MPAALLGQRVELGLPAGFGFFPFRLQPAFVFQTMEPGIEGALMDLEEFLRNLLKALGDGIAVAWAQGDNLQDQHVEGSAEEFLFAFGHLRYLDTRHICPNQANVNRSLQPSTKCLIGSKSDISLRCPEVRFEEMRCCGALLSSRCP